MQRMAASLGVQHAECTASPDAICASIFSGTEFQTQVARIPAIGVDMSRLCRLEVLSRRLAASPGECTIEELTDCLDEIEHAPLQYPRWLTVPSLGAACAAFCGVIHGTPWQMVAAAVGAGVGHVLRLRLMARHSPLITIVVGCSFLSSFSAYLAARLISVGAQAMGRSPIYPGPAVLASVLFLIPGVPIVTSLIDVINFDLTSGLARAAHASFVVVCIAVGILLFLSLTGFGVT